MIRFLQPDDALFSSPAYDRDRTAFDQLESIRRAPLLLAGDGARFAAGRDLPGMPAWLWTADGLGAPALGEVAAMALESLAEGDMLRVVAKPAAADAIARAAARRAVTEQRRIRLQAFVNPQPCPPRDRTARVERPTQADLPALAACMAGFARECFEDEPEPDILLRRAASALGDPLLLIVREAGELASMAYSARETARHRAISQVYTRPSSRGRGYAAALAFALSCRILSLGRTPMLYADTDNRAAARAYESVGFTPCGRVDELTLRWEAWA